MLCFCILSIFNGLVYWNLDDGMTGTLNRVNVLFLHCMFLLLMVGGGRGGYRAGEGASV